MIETINQWDTQLFLFLNGLHSPCWDNVMWEISGKLTWLPLYLILLGYIIYRFRWRSLLIMGFIALLITLADQFSVHLFKEVFMRLRPCHNPEIADMVHLVNNHCGGQYGFVSSHAANTFAIASFTSFLLRRRWYGIFIFTWAAVVSYSRIYLGVHYPGDILGGALLGFLLGFLLILAYRYAEKLIYK